MGSFVAFKEAFDGTPVVLFRLGMGGREEDANSKRTKEGMSSAVAEGGRDANFEG